MSSPPLVVCLMGPTAAGKTALAIELARRMPFGVISVDSALVYRRMNIGTGKPGPSLLAEVPHRLIDIREPWESYSAGEFVRDARAAIAEVADSGRVPLLVGGTMLYFRSLWHGLSALPEGDSGLRAEIDQRGATLGWPVLHAELGRVDPLSAARLQPNDRQRIQRALEVWYLTGIPLSAQQGRGSAPGDLRFLRIAVLPGDRKLLHARIEARFREMLAQGFVGEVEGLMRLPEMHAERPAMRAVGYRQLWGMLAGDYDQDAAERRALAATRQLAKRQLTWLRHEAGVQGFVMESGDLPGAVEAVLRSEGVRDALSASSG
ncbi:MAG: tRNA (adenosine(37)-N6)-dimethylallyltransferase MiaA [Gammaproteobacteria bacterium]|nr:tRNA (adenosine(37)-N6)-dimethylallyltransferase MiaA [Gammaproteobacteria bacterium]